MIVSKEFEYDPRKFDKPWGAVLVRRQSGCFTYDKSKHRFFGTHGSDEAGGVIEIDADDCDIVAFGQKEKGKNETIHHFKLIDGRGLVDVEITSVDPLYDLLY